MSDQPLATIIIVNYNGVKFLPRLLKSISSQAEKNIETIVVDNASTDTSVQYIKKEFPKIKVVKTENKGYGYGCNTGARHAKGKHLLFLNPDIYLPKDFTTKILSFFYQTQKNNPHKKIGAIGCKVINFDSNPKDTPNVTISKIDIFGNPLDLHISNPSQKTLIVGGIPFFIERKTFLQTKGFNENIFLYGEEIEYSWRIKILGYENFITPDVYFYHYGSGIVGKEASPQKIAFMIYGLFLASYTNYSLLTLLLICPIYLLYLITIFLSLPILTKFKLNYNYQILICFSKFFKNIKNINFYRNYVQKNRRLNDLQIIKYISPIPAVISRASYKQFIAPAALTNR